MIDCAAHGMLTSLLAGCDARLLDWLMHHWPLFARSDQLPPDGGASRDDWTVWLVLGGRGAGKTRTGAEWVRGMALGQPSFTSAPAGRIALVGETAPMSAM
ncbi:hypothetical protein CHELA1G11_13168 [Hyphomicrobiales bacterium]|nr:hypothetical protein CHELA1G2_11142 [Hyphomicrobiales bacterium]CAH1669781.1 hypothetical protein CHELA1G11_13168 [Hyphomicrobiales bacterium]